MPVYEYKALDGAGKPTTGIEDAENARAARAKLRRRSVFVTEIWEQKASGGGKKGKGLSTEVDFSKYFQRVKVQDIATMTSQLSTLSGAGIPVVEALTALIEQSENPKLQVVLAEVREQVNEGTSLAEALKGHPKIFDDLYINMVRAGEASGALDTVLDRLSSYTESQVQLRSKLISALTYPILMTFVAGGIVLGLFTFVIPKIRQVFASFNAELPFVTQLLLDISDFTLNYWWTLLIIVPLLALGFRRWVGTDTGRRRWDNIKLTMPVFGRINRLVAVSRFCRTFSTLLDSGVPILTALSITRDVVQNRVLADAIQNAANNISEGQSIAVPLRASGEFPPIVTHMIAIGEKTGELESMLGKVADAYDNLVDSIVTTLTSLLTPALTIMMGGVVALIAVAILLPMMQMSSIAR
jgi:general secretion pathway protein F